MTNFDVGLTDSCLKLSKKF